MKNDDLTELVERFKEFIFERDLTYQQVALLLRISRSTVSDILSGRRKKILLRTEYKIRKLIERGGK
jgi:transcriptional regulator with XRE-family HTH domain